jgi:DNA-binding XRE family transcriptional regulator
MAELSINQKKEWAQQLYCEDKLKQKLIATKVGVAEKTISKWVNDGNWDRLRKSLLVSKQEQLANMYEQLSEINSYIKSKPEGERFADSKQADIMVKITASIEQLEEETNMADVFEVGKRFIRFLQEHDFEKAKEIVDLYDSFIKNCLKQS